MLSYHEMLNIHVCPLFAKYTMSHLKYHITLQHKSYITTLIKCILIYVYLQQNQEDQNGLSRQADHEDPGKQSYIRKELQM